MEYISVNNDGSINITFAQSDNQIPITLPKDKEEHYIYIGQTHNLAVVEIKETKAQKVIAIQDTCKIDKGILDALYSKEMKQMFMEN